MQGIRQLRRYIEDETDAMNVTISAIYRAALYTAVLNHDKFVQLFKKLKIIVFFLVANTGCNVILPYNVENLSLNMS